jgi:hypothetical protein
MQNAPARCRYRTGAKARVYIPAGCPVRNMAKQNVKQNAEMAGEKPTGASLLRVL